MNEVGRGFRERTAAVKVELSTLKRVVWHGAYRLHLMTQENPSSAMFLNFPEQFKQKKKENVNFKQFVSQLSLSTS